VACSCSATTIFKLARALAGHGVRIDDRCGNARGNSTKPLRQRAAAEIAARRLGAAGKNVFVHGGFHTAMLETVPPPLPSGRAEGVLARALYGERARRPRCNKADRSPDGGRGRNRPLPGMPGLFGTRPAARRGAFGHRGCGGRLAV